MKHSLVVGVLVTFLVVQVLTKPQLENGPTKRLRSTLIRVIITSLSRLHWIDRDGTLLASG